jgi:fructose-bisphosphate aldolase class I
MESTQLPPASNPKENSIAVWSVYRRDKIALKREKNMNTSLYGLETVARSLVAAGKGILAADESFATIKNRFEQIGVESTEQTRRVYRELLFTTPGIEDSISGVILFDETIRQSAADNMPFVELLAEKGIRPGIKVDRGTIDLAGFTGEKITEGLDGLKNRVMEYHQIGARFAKWRAVFKIGKGLPTRCAIYANAHALARYAAICQQNDLVPIVEPEVLMDGPHNIHRCAEVTEGVLQRVFAELNDHRVVLEAVLLKPNMVLSGKDCPDQAGAAEVAETTVRTLRRAVPPAVPGVVFLSGGQSARQATENLNLMNAMGIHPWQLSFSYGRALQEPVLKTWAGDTEMMTDAQEQFFKRARCNSAARSGKYHSEMEIPTPI